MLAATAKSNTAVPVKPSGPSSAAPATSSFAPCVTHSHIRTFIELIHFRLPQRDSWLGVCLCGQFGAPFPKGPPKSSVGHAQDACIFRACTSHPGVLGSIPKREEPGKTERHPLLKYRVPHGSQLRINLNVEGCGIVAVPVHAPSRAPLLIPLLLSHNLPLPRAF